MVIAPNKLFLNYISEVLPELGVERVVQSTFETFAMGLLGKKFKVRDPNEKLISFISTASDNVQIKNRPLYKSSELKASMKFKSIIDKYVEYVEESFIPREDFKLEGVVVYTYEKINNLFLKEYKRWPVVKRMYDIKKHLNSRLKIMRDKIINNLHEKCDEKVQLLKDTMQDNDERHKLIVEAIDERIEKIEKLEAISKKAVNEYVKRLSKFSPWQHYSDLMGNTPLLQKLSLGLADPETVEHMAMHTSKTISSGF